MPKIKPPAVNPVVSTLNREAWLTELARMIEPSFAGMRVKPYRVTCGWPCKNPLGMKSRAVGECHCQKSSKTGHYELFISPLLDSPLEVGGVLSHELAHVVAGVEAKHGKEFVRVCRHAGITKGKPREVMPGPDLNERLEKIIMKLGAYPHSAIVPKTKERKPPNGVTLCCGECGCTVRMSLKWLESAGAPLCGCGGTFGMKGDG